jgi:hypothetical protein
MSIYPQGEDLKRAIKWISEEKTNNAEISLYTLIDKACLKFDLPPNDSEFLMRFLKSSSDS